MKDTLTQAQQRTRAYWFADGLNEIISGIFGAIYGGLILLTNRAKSGTPQADMLSNTANIFLLFGVFLLPVLLRWMKERSTYPRSGYVTYPELKTAERLRRVIPIMIIVFLLAALIATSILASAQTRLWVIESVVWLPTAMGVVFGVILIRSAQVTGLSRHFLLGCLSLVTAAWLGWRSLPLMGRLSLVGLFAGDGFGPMPPEAASVMQDLMTAVYSNAALLLIIVSAAVIVLGMAARYNYLRETKNARPE